MGNNTVTLAESISHDIGKGTRSAILQTGWAAVAITAIGYLWDWLKYKWEAKEKKEEEEKKEMKEGRVDRDIAEVRNRVAVLEKGSETRKDSEAVDAINKRHRNEMDQKDLELVEAKARLEAMELEIVRLRRDNRILNNLLKLEEDPLSVWVPGTSGVDFLEEGG